MILGLVEIEHLFLVPNKYMNPDSNKQVELQRANN